MIGVKSVPKYKIRKSPKEISERARLNAILKRMQPTEIYQLLRAYFNGSLARWDNEDKLPDAIAITIREFFAITTGKSLIEQSRHQQIKAIITEMDRSPTAINGAAFPNYQEHLLACAVGSRDYTDQQWENLPAPLPRQQREALERFARLLHDWVLSE